MNKNYPSRAERALAIDEHYRALFAPGNHRITEGILIAIDRPANHPITPPGGNPIQLGELFLDLHLANATDLRKLRAKGEHFKDALAVSMRGLVRRLHDLEYTERRQGLVGMTYAALGDRLSDIGFTIEEAPMGTIHLGTAWAIESYRLGSPVIAFASMDTLQQRYLS